MSVDHKDGKESAQKRVEKRRMLSEERRDGVEDAGRRVNFSEDLVISSIYH